LHVAIITFGYPPLAHVSGTRPSNLARELARLGHAVTVVTVDWSTRESPPPSSDGIHLLAIDPRPWFPGFSTTTPPFTTEPPFVGPAALRRARTLGRTLRWGPYASWARAALRALLARHRASPVDVVWAIHGDDSSHEIAYRFAREAGVPWVADFKDPWDLFHKRAVVWLQELVTRRRLRTASALTETCQAQGDSDSARFHLPAHVLWTGYEADVMERATPERLSEKAFVLAYVGNLAAQHDVDAVARMLAAWEAFPERATSMPIELHAFCNDATPLKKRLEARGVTHCLHEHRFVPRERAYGIMKGADALLLLPATFHVPSGGSIGVKELEYLASGTPVLSIGKLLPELDPVARGCPQLVEAGTAEAAAAWMLAEAANPGRSRATVNLPSVVAHSWPAKGKALAAILEGASKRR
jgi:glycosyltransferase involved in cell wall biosynthesis